jgi:hypothetical protein
VLGLVGEWCVGAGSGGHSIRDVATYVMYKTVILFCYGSPQFIDLRTELLMDAGFIDGIYGGIRQI